jgi:hypothetical protein
MKIEKGETINYGLGFTFDNEEINFLIIKWYINIYFKN